MHVETEDAAENMNNVVYIVEPGFVIMAAPDKDTFLVPISRKFRKAGKLVRVACKFDNG